MCKYLADQSCKLPCYHVIGTDCMKLSHATAGILSTEIESRLSGLSDHNKTLGLFAFKSIVEFYDCYTFILVMIY